MQQMNFKLKSTISRQQTSEFELIQMTTQNVKEFALRIYLVDSYREIHLRKRFSLSIYLVVCIRRMIANPLVQPKNINSSAPRF